VYTLGGRGWKVGNVRGREGGLGRNFGLHKGFGEGKIGGWVKRVVHKFIGKVF